MSDQQVEQTSSEPGSLDAKATVPAASATTPTEPVTASAPEPTKEAAQGLAQASADVESPTLVPEQGAVAEAANVHAFKPDAAKDSAKADAPREPGRIMIMSSADHHGWTDDEEDSEQEAEPNQSMFGKRRIAALAAVVALAALAGALGGAMATAGLTHVADNSAATADNHALEASIARIDSDIQALKVSVEHTSRLGMSQFNKTSERLDKVEKAMAEPAAKLAKLSETVDKLKAAPAPVPVAAAAAPKEQKEPREVTGSVTQPAATSAPATAPKVEVGRLPTVEGWFLRDVANGGALIDGRQGIYEVYAGDVIPGLGRIDAVRRQDGRWVVVTSRGLIVAR